MKEETLKEEETLNEEEEDDLGIEEAKEVLAGLLKECKRRIASATVSQRRLHEKLAKMWCLFQYSLGRMNAIRQEELWMRVRAAECDARQIDVEIEKLRKEYERINRHYSKLLR